MERVWQRGGPWVANDASIGLSMLRGRLGMCHMVRWDLTPRDLALRSKLRLGTYRTLSVGKLHDDG